ncbi:MAG: Ribosomal large subunit pseudouridine synthase D [Ignavibacteriae bacterium]|nr:MAG: Ribosomal large subunit pseudouridine synthase D [Ignavibacteriota bacterium]
MTQKFQILVPAGQNRERIDVFLTNHIENTTRSKVQEAIEAGYVLVNGKITKPGYKVNPGDVIDISLPKPPPQTVKAEQIPLNIVYEDDYIIVVNKPAGMVTHPAYGNYTGTLVNALLYHCQGKLAHVNEVADQDEDTDIKDRVGYEPLNARAGIVHRLDKDTSGLIVVAKDDFAHSFLAKQFANRTIEREYWAIVWGRFGKQKKGIIEANLARSKSDRKKVAVSESGKYAVTEYEVITEFDFLSLIKLKLKTGRTHQIRVHMHHIGHPVFGDPTYGGRRISYGENVKKDKLFVEELLGIMKRQALHAKTIGFIHPITKEKMFFDSKLPVDMQKVLRLLKSYNQDDQ